MDILNRISSELNQLTKKEQILAEYILNNSAEVTGLSIVELAELLNISNATITRFCKKFDFQSFVQLKMALSEVNGKYCVTENKNSIEDQVKSFYLLTIDKTKNFMSSSDLQHLVKKIKTAKNIYIFGIGSSGEIGRLLGTRLKRMGINAMAVTDVDEIMIDALKVTRDDIVFFISKSGETQALINALKACHLSEAYTVAVTGYSQSTLSKKTDFTYLIDTTSYLKNKEFFHSQISMHYFLDVLSLYLISEGELESKMISSYNTIKKIKERENE